MEMKKMLGIGAMGLALVGCEPPKEKVNLADSYKPKIVQQVERTEQATSQLEGKIVKVQPSSLSFKVGFLDTSSRIGNHEFEYVIMKDNNGRTHTLIYPYSKAILDGEAVVQYRELPLGVISTRDFVHIYIDENYGVDDNFFLEAGGFIVKDGIKYQERR